MVDSKKILTERLVLVPASYNIIISLLRKETQAAEEIGLKYNNSWPTADTYDILSFLSKMMNSTQALTGFDTIWMIAKKDNMEVIGDAGFKGNPDENGEVEIGYGIISEERQKGYGFEAVKALIDWGFSHNNVSKIKAECLINNNGSIRILQKIEMHEVKRDDEYIYWNVLKNVNLK